MKRTLIVASFSAAALLGGCSTTPDGSDVYTQESVGQVMRVETGTVVGLRAVKIRLTDSEGVGTASGAVIGGVVGSGVSENRRAAAVGAVVGAVVGGTLGKMAERQAATTPGWEITYRDAQGQTRVVVQPMKGLENLRVGQRIRIVHTPDGVRISPL